MAQSKLAQKICKPNWARIISLVLALFAGEAMPSVEDQFVNSIRAQETGGLKDPWVRTMVKGSGSSAYGPFQTTKGLNAGYLKTNPGIFSGDEIAALSRLVEQQEISLKVGGSDRKKFEKRISKEDLDRYDYGGTFSIPDQDKPLIESAQRKMLLDTLRESGNDPEEAAKRWHGGVKHGNRADHSKYASDVVKRITRDPRPSRVDKSIQGGRTFR